MDIEQVQSIIKKLEDHEKRILALEQRRVQKKEGQIDKKQSLREFILLKKPGDDVQLALVIGYYLENIEGVESFNIQDLEMAFREAKETVPKNLNDKVNKNIRKGYLMETKQQKDNKKAWVLTASGEKFVENNLHGA